MLCQPNADLAFNACRIATVDKRDPERTGEIDNVAFEQGYRAKAIFDGLRALAGDRRGFAVQLASYCDHFFQCGRRQLAFVPASLVPSVSRGGVPRPFGVSSGATDDRRALAGGLALVRVRRA